MRVHPVLVRLAVTLLGSLALLTAWAGPAGAHAYLQSSTPAQGSVVAASPPLLVLHFSEQVGTSLSSMTVLDASGHDVATGAVLQPFNVGTDLGTALTPRLANGTYLVVWRVVSDDSHPTAGSFSFSVGKPGAVAGAGNAAGTQAGMAGSVSADPKVGAVLGFGRLLGFVGVAAFLGGVAFVLVCWPSGARSRASRRTLQGGWLLAFVGSLATLGLEGPYGAGETLAHTFDWSLIDGVAQTRFGHALLARVVLLVLTAAAAAWAIRSRRTAGTAAFAVLAAATLVTFPYTGHPSVGSQVPLAVVSDVLHLAAMSIWFGGLLHLSLVVLPDEDEATVRAAATRFSRAAMASVVVLVATGVYQAWREAGIAASLLTTRYGKLLVVKTGIVLAVLVVAEVSRRWVAGTPSGSRRLGLSVSIESAVVVVVLAVTSLLVSGVPARSDYRPSSDLHLVAGPVHLELAVDPMATRVVDVRVDTTDAAGDALGLDELTLTLQLDTPAAGPLNVRLAPIGDTQFQATGVELPYTGRWTFALVARTSKTQEYTGRASIEVR